MYNSVRVPAAVPAGDVELKHLLWTLQQQWGASTGAWLEAPFLDLDVADMAEQVRAAQSTGALAGSCSCIGSSGICLSSGASGAAPTTATRATTTTAMRLEAQSVEFLFED